MTNARTTTLVIILCLTFALSSAAQAESGSRQRSFALPNHGKLLLGVPAAWKQAVRQPPHDLPPTITFTPAKGDDFVVFITPLWSAKNDPTFNKPENVRRLMEESLGRMLRGSVEQKATLQEFAGVHGKGYFFFLTDKAPKPGEYPYAVRTGLGVGDLLLSATVLCRSKNSEGITSTIKALQEARQAR
ncbi:MAG: hypothetical protein RBT20_00305 [Syntrophales bacterium]|nr:hypothetical protein [Syntrophales bacterium]